jgi:Glycosyltransferases involved in cell wall biogenesis
MKKKRILSIGIPTFNRENELKVCLESILGQIDGYEDMVEIVISDNASTDNTKAVIKGIASLWRKVKIIYHCNNENRGPDFNILKCISLSSGEYIQLLSDDDILLPGAIHYILSIIAGEKPDYIYLNFGFLDKYRIRRKDYMNGILAQFKESDSKGYHNKDMFLDYVGIYITVLSAMIYRSELVKAIPNKEKLIGTRFIQSHLALLIISNARKIFFASKCCVIIRDANSGGFNLFDVWIKSYKKLILKTAVESGFDKKICQRVFKRSCQNEISSMIYYIRSNNIGFGLRNRKTVILYTWMYPTLWKYLYPATFLPLDILDIIQMV